MIVHSLSNQQNQQAYCLLQQSHTKNEIPQEKIFFKNPAVFQNGFFLTNLECLLNKIERSLNKGCIGS
jgi:hypothetical protein